MTVLLSQVPVLIVVFGVSFYYDSLLVVEDTETARQRQRQQMRDSRFHQ
jgi:hypothetical protein